MHPAYRSVRFDTQADPQNPTIHYGCYKCGHKDSRTFREMQQLGINKHSPSCGKCGESRRYHILGYGQHDQKIPTQITKGKDDKSRAA